MNIKTRHLSTNLWTNIYEYTFMYTYIYLCIQVCKLPSIISIQADHKTRNWMLQGSLGDYINDR